MKIFENVDTFVIRIFLSVKISDLYEDIKELEDVIPLYIKHNIPTLSSISRLNSYKNLVRRIEKLKLKYNRKG